MRAALREWEAHNVTLHELRLFAADPAAFADAAHGDPGTQRMLEKEGVHVAQLNETARIALSCRQLGQRNQSVAAAMEAAGYAVPPPGNEEADGPSSARGAAGAESQLQATSL